MGKSKVSSLSKSVSNAVVNNVVATASAKPKSTRKVDVQKAQNFIKNNDVRDWGDGTYTISKDTANARERYVNWNGNRVVDYAHSTYETVDLEYNGQGYVLSLWQGRYPESPSKIWRFTDSKNATSKMNSLLRDSDKVDASSIDNLNKYLKSKNKGK